MKRLFVEAGVESLVFKDEAGNMKYQLREEKTLSTRQKYILSDSEDQKVGEINKIRNSFGLFNLPQYHIEAAGWSEVVIKKEMQELRENYQIQGEGLSIQGDWWSRNFSVYKGDEKIAVVKEPQPERRKGFEIEEISSSDERLVVCFLAGIHLVYENERAYTA